MKASIARGKPIQHIESAYSSNPVSSSRPSSLKPCNNTANRWSQSKQGRTTQKACMHSRPAPNVRVESNTKQRLVLATKEPNNIVSRASHQQTVKQGVSPADKGLVNSSRPVKRGGSSHTSYSYGCHRVSKQAARRFWRPKLPPNGTS